jgi:hypothetical protein
MAEKEEDWKKLPLKDLWSAVVGGFGVWGRSNAEVPKEVGVAVTRPLAITKIDAHLLAEEDGEDIELLGEGGKEEGEQDDGDDEEDDEEEDEEEQEGDQGQRREKRQRPAPDYAKMNSGTDSDDE